MVVAGALLLWTLSPPLALAGPVMAWVAISEPETNTQFASLSDSNFIPTTNPATLGGAFASQAGTSISIINEGVGVLGAVDMHFEYSDSTPLASGTFATVNFNFFAGTTLSDTLGMAFTGQTPTTGDPNNMSVDLHWRSDSADGLLPPTLPNAHNLNEIPWATGNPASELFPFIHSDTGLSGTHVVVNSVSSVPEPSSVVMMGLGVLGLGGLVLRHRRQS
jgi:hypothetical protein